MNEPIRFYDRTLGRMTRRELLNVAWKLGLAAVLQPMAFDSGLRAADLQALSVRARGGVRRAVARWRWPTDGLRLRLHSGRPAHRAHGECARHDVGAGALRGPFLQLVRHAVGQAAAAALCLVGGQRQSRGASDDVAAGTRGACRRQDRRRPLVRRLERHGARARRGHRRDTFRRRCRACCAISKPRTTRGRRRSRRRGSGSTGSARASAKSPRGSARRSRVCRIRFRRRACAGGRSGLLGPRRSSANAGRCRRSSHFSRRGARLPAGAAGIGAPDRPPRYPDAARARRTGSAIARRRIERRPRSETPARGPRHARDEFVEAVIEASRRAARANRGDRAPRRWNATSSRGWSTSFLYDKARHLLAIGYNVSERRRDASYYDLLASEARFASFVAIAQGQLPQENWFALGRLLTDRPGASACCCRGAARCSST